MPCFVRAVLSDWLGLGAIKRAQKTDTTNPKSKRQREFGSAGPVSTGELLRCSAVVLQEKADGAAAVEIEAGLRFFDVGLFRACLILHCLAAAVDAAVVLCPDLLAGEHAEVEVPTHCFRDILHGPLGLREKLIDWEKPNEIRVVLSICDD